MKTKILMVALMLLAMTPAIQAKSSTKTVAHRGYWKCEGSEKRGDCSFFEGLFKSRKEVETHDIGAGT